MLVLLDYYCIDVILTHIKLLNNQDQYKFYITQERHDIAEILLRLALNTNQPINKSPNKFLSEKK
jgi:hypothetical protein